jgi:hypothetical protein
MKQLGVISSRQVDGRAGPLDIAYSTTNPMIATKATGTNSNQTITSSPVTRWNDNRRYAAMTTLVGRYSSEHICGIGVRQTHRGAGMTAVTRKDVIETFGELDDVTVANIMETGSTQQELAEAQAWLANDEALINTGRSLRTGRVGQIVEIIADKDQEEEEQQ